MADWQTAHLDYPTVAQGGLTRCRPRLWHADASSMQRLLSDQPASLDVPRPLLLVIRLKSSAGPPEGSIGVPLGLVPRSSVEASPPYLGHRSDSDRRTPVIRWPHLLHPLGEGVPYSSVHETRFVAADRVRIRCSAYEDRAIETRTPLVHTPRERVNSAQTALTVPCPSVGFRFLARF
jgi:hypothetical protein